MSSGIDQRRFIPQNGWKFVFGMTKQSWKIKSVFRVMQLTTQISPISLNQGAFFAHKFKKGASKIAQKQRAMSFPMYFQCATAKLMSV